MGKVTVQTLSPKELQNVETELWDTLKKTQSMDRLLILLHSLLTESEQIMCGRRIQIAKLLLAGSSHRTISEKLKVGLTTVQSTDRWLRASGDYRMTFPSLFAEFERLKAAKFTKAYGNYLSQIRRKYPLQMFLFSLLMGPESQ